MNERARESNEVLIVDPEMRGSSGHALISMLAIASDIAQSSGEDLICVFEIAAYSPEQHHLPVTSETRIESDLRHDDVFGSQATAAGYAAWQWLGFREGQTFADPAFIENAERWNVQRFLVVASPRRGVRPDPTDADMLRGGDWDGFRERLGPGGCLSIWSDYHFEALSVGGCAALSFAKRFVGQCPPWAIWPPADDSES